MAKKKVRARTERRTLERDVVKTAEAALKLAQLQPGGSAEHPIVLTSASVIEPHASGLPCVACGASVRVEEHGAAPERGLRVVKIRCPRCGVGRDLYFRLAQPN